MWRISVVSGLMMFVGNILFAQYGNEWIESDKSYFKIQVVEDGMYRVTATELSNAGVPISTIATSRYQLFHHGEEVAIQVFDDNGDGRVDYFDFYGEKNDGRLDTELYVNANAQPHDYYSLFTDTASYFLTWHITSTSGKRMPFSTINNPDGVGATDFHLEKELKLQTSSFSSGVRYGSSFDIQSAVYDYGEGWVGGNISKGGSKSFDFLVDNPNSSGSKPHVELVVHGISNLSHVTDVSVGPNSTSLRSIGQVSFTGRYHQKFSSDVEWTDVSASGDLVVKITSVGVSGQTDVIAVGYVKVIMPQNFDLGNASKKYTIPDSDNPRQYIVIPTTTASDMRVFDISDPANVARVAKTNFSDRLEFVYEDTTSQEREFFVTSAVKSVASVSRSSIASIDLSAVDYLLISHESLNATVDGVNPVEAYVSYRESAAGGSHQVELTYIDQLYDQFSYGLTSPLAIKNYLAYAQAVGSPQHVFLIGKATSVNHNYHRQTSSNLVHHVPTFGYPGSDVLFGVPDGQTMFNIPIGRINTFSASDVSVYLNKVKEMESTGYEDLWRKSLIHLSGGQSPAELNAFKNYINNFKSLAVGDYLGGEVSSVNKNSTDEVKLINVADEVNSGVSLITFFGHSSGVVTDVEIGRASDPNAGYSNKGKYPVILVNGCNAGGIFGGSTASNLTFGEDWIRTPDAGALGFIANSDLALSSNLKRYSDLFYAEAFTKDETFGISVGEIMKNAASRYFDLYGTGELSQTQVYQTVLQGDPAITVFGAQSPDYHLLEGQISAEGYNLERVVANVDSFQLKLVVRNYGRSTDDSVKVQVRRTFADGSSKEYVRLFERILRQDTLSFSIVNEAGDAVEGTNNFLISLDFDNEIDELNEGNNVANFDLFIPRGNTIVLYPQPYATTSQSVVDLVWQSANMLEQDRTYALEVDTSFAFNSPFSFSESFDGQLLNAYPLDLTDFPDSTTVYWRTRFAEAVANEDTNWVTSSFTLIHDQSEGWGQVDGGQFLANSLTGVGYEAEGKVLDFDETSTSIQVNTHGANSTLQYEDYQVIVDGLNLLLTDNAADPTCKRLNAINAVFFDRETAQPFRPLGTDGTDVFNDLVCGRLPQMIHNLNENDVLGTNRYLDSLIGVIDERDVVLLFSFGTVNYESWDAQLLSSLSQIGIQSSTINSLQAGQPVVFVGRKGNPEGSAIELTSNGTTLPPQDQALELLDVVTGKFSSGKMVSTRLGPARSWGSFHYSVKDEPNDSWQVNVYGVNRSGDISPLLTGNRVSQASELDLSGVDVSQYPYLQLDFLFADIVDQTAPTLNSWGVTYQDVPEGILTASSIASENLKEGQTFNRAFYFSNLANVDFSDSLDVDIAIVSQESGDVEAQQLRIPGAMYGDTSVFEVSTATRGKVGLNNVSVTVATPDLENYFSNNGLILSGAFNVEEDLVNPVLDVTIDGNYILSGDIVSPSPNIRVTMRDDNEFLFKDDTSGVSIELKRDCETCTFERVNLGGSEVTYTVASEDQDFEVLYQPTMLEDGIYTLRVQVTDETGNKSGLEPYEISFEVINESTISHFYPYPNPFSTATRFVFTLTGSVLPDQIKIQIMTVSGRVVREITQDEIGPIKIGNNITQYAWDGRDEFGDRLANGVYLYKVFIKQNGQSIDHRITSGDRGFKNGFGKIYLLR
jgi:hypothetical protein